MQANPLFCFFHCQLVFNALFKALTDISTGVFDFFYCLLQLNHYRNNFPICRILFQQFILMMFVELAIGLSNPPKWIQTIFYLAFVVAGRALTIKINNRFFKTHSYDSAFDCVVSLTTICFLRYLLPFLVSRYLSPVQFVLNLIIYSSAFAYDIFDICSERRQISVVKKHDLIGLKWFYYFGFSLNFTFLQTLIKSPYLSNLVFVTIHPILMMCSNIAQREQLLERIKPMSSPVPIYSIVSLMSISSVYCILWILNHVYPIPQLIAKRKLRQQFEGH